MRKRTVFTISIPGDSGESNRPCSPRPGNNLEGTMRDGDELVDLSFKIGGPPLRTCKGENRDSDRLNRNIELSNQSLKRETRHKTVSILNTSSN